MAKSSGSKIYSIYIVAGKDAHLRSRALEQIRRQTLGEDQGIGEVRFDGKNAELATILDEVRTLPFLAERKMVVVEEADKFITDNRKELEDYFKKPSEDGVLVLVVDSWRSKTNLDKMLTTVGSLVSAESMKGQQLIGWLAAQARAMDKDLSVPAADLLISTVGTDSGRLTHEVEKLALYVGERRQISAEDIRALTVQTAEENVFMIIDLMATGRADQALKVLGQVLEADRSAEYSMVGAMTYSLRRLLKARAMLDSGMSTAEVFSACKIFYGSIKEQFAAQLKRWSSTQLKRLIDELTQLDYANKTGLGPARLNLEKFILCGTLKA